jgi:hypothetical protein
LSKQEPFQKGGIIRNATFQKNALSQNCIYSTHQVLYPKGLVPIKFHHG